MRKLSSFMLRMLKDQRGEVGDEEPGSEEIDDEIIEIDPDDLEEDEEDEERVAKEAAKEKEDEDLKAEIVKRDELLKTQEETIKESNRNFYKMRKKFESLETKDKEVGFTDTQLEGMIEEHQDDPKALLQIFKRVSEQTVDSKADSFTKATEITQRQKELEDHLVATWPDVHNEGTKTHKDIQHAKEYMHVADHPLGDFIGGASMMFLQLPEIIEKAKKEARESALKGEDNRKKTIKENSLETGKKKNDSKEMPDNYQATVKQLNMTKTQAAIYKQIRSGDNKTATVEV